MKISIYSLRLRFNFPLYNTVGGYGLFRYNPWIKRVMDIVISIMGLVLSLPLAIVIYILIKLEDGGTTFYSQERIGYRGKPFTIYKFRTMTPCSEAAVPLLCEIEDSRLTRTGIFIRNHHLDEIPQLWNVLKGEMSLVGPRPERRYFIEKIEKYDFRYRQLYNLRPGLFSMATLYNGYTDTVEKMLKRLGMDLEYMETISFALDIKIIILTLIALLSGRKF